jgi:hypothetical protein
MGPLDGFRSRCCLQRLRNISGICTRDVRQLSVQMVVRILSSTEKLNVQVFYLMACTLLYSSIGCLVTWHALVWPSTATQLALLVGQGMFGYGNQVRLHYATVQNCCR